MAAKKKVLVPRPIIGEGGRVIGIDSSLTGTGVAILDPVTKAWLGTTTIKTTADNGTLTSLRARLVHIADSIEAFVEGFQPEDVVVIEGYMQAPSAKRGEMIVNWHETAFRAVDAGIEPVKIAPATLKAYAIGGSKLEAGGAKDRIMIQAFRRFPEAGFATNDEADAVFLAALGADLVGLPVEPEPLPATHRTFERHFEPRPDLSIQTA